jgi:hypothetical protein
MKNFVEYTSRKCFASARVASPRLRNITHTRKISFSGLVIQITIVKLFSVSQNAHCDTEVEKGTFYTYVLQYFIYDREIIAPFSK